MELDKKEKELLENALKEWEQQNLLTNEKADELRSTLKTSTAGGKIAKYFFLIAIACTLLAFGAIFIDDKLLEHIKHYFDVSNLVIAVSCTVIALLWFIYLARKRNAINNMIYEVYMVLGGLVTICAIVYYCKDIGFGPQYTGLLIAITLIVTTLSIYYKSRALWLGAVLALMGFYGSYAEWQQDSNNLFLGMNYPMRFTVFGVLIIAISFIQSKLSELKFSQKHTYIIGLLIFFTGLWGVSIFGNYGHYDEWLQVRQVQVIGYSLILAIVSIAALLLGIKYEDDVTRDFGIIFILLNLYSRYFEFFWNTTNKGIFFLILAVSFAIVGWQIEKRFKKNRIQEQAR